jgi:hypothetical protein
MSQVTSRRNQAAFLQGEITASFLAGTGVHGFQPGALQRGLLPTYHTSCLGEDFLPTQGMQCGSPPAPQR